MSENLEDFELFLEDDFDVHRFGNDLIKATNTDDSTAELDIDTPIKKINYDIGEIDTRIEQLINNNPLQILDQISRAKTARATVRDGLTPSLDYLDMSYKRLQEVSEPYEKAQKLQNVLSKVHQTSMLLRDALIYIHLVNSIKSIKETTPRLNPQKSLELASLHSQLQLGISQRANLKSLRLIKKFDTEVVEPSFKELFNYLTTELDRVGSESEKLNNNKENVVILLRALHSLSPQEFANTVQRIVLSHIQSSIQSLVKTINFVKSFPSAMELAVKKGYTVFLLQSFLRDIKSDNTNLLNEYTSHMKPKPLTPKEFYWTQVSNGFKKDLEVSYKRGGPVGKVLQKSREFIEQTIRRNMANSPGNADYEDDIQIMLNSIAILSTEDH